MKLSFTFLLLLSTWHFTAIAAEPSSITSPDPVGWMDEARAGTVRMLVWSTVDGERLHAQRLDTTTQQPMGTAQVISDADSTIENTWRIGQSSKPVIAANASDGTFLVAWHAKLFDITSGTNIGTELAGRIITPVDGDAAFTLGPMMRLSRLDDDSLASAGTETRSAPAVSHDAISGHYLVAWMHWPDGREIETHDGVRYTTNQPVIAAQNVSANGPQGASIVLDDQPSPDADLVNGGHQRLEDDIIHFALSPLHDKQGGHLLLWSDASQRENGHAMLFSKMVPSDLSQVALNDRTSITDSSSAGIGIHGVALARVGNNGRYFAAFEDGGGTRQTAAAWLNSTGAGELPVNRTEPRFIAIDRISNEDRFVHPDVLDVPALERVVVQAVIGTRDVANDEGVMDARLVYVTLDARAIPGANANSEPRVIAPHAQVTTRDHAKLHAAGDLPEGNGLFNAVVDPDDNRIIRLHVTSLDADPNPEPNDPDTPGNPDEPKEPADPKDPPSSGGGGGGGAFGWLSLIAIAGFARYQGAAR